MVVELLLLLFSMFMLHYDVIFTCVDPRNIVATPVVANGDPNK